MGEMKGMILIGCIAVFLVLMLAVLVRAVLGPRFTDRVVAVNVINTMVLAVLVLLGLVLEVDYLIDIGLVYALLSFLAVVVLSRLTGGKWSRRMGRKTEGQEGGEA